MDHKDILEEVRSYLENLITSLKPDLIVCTERKATAIMRCLIEEVSPALRWNWAQVLSSTVITQFDWKRFEGHRILLFDELVYHGRTLHEHLGKLRRLRPNDEIITAGFVVRERCRYRPDISYYGNVDTQTYEDIRDSLVRALQDHGSLLLDTEHLELTIKLQCGLRDFYDSLSRASEDGNTWSFLSGAGRINLTIERPDIMSPSELERVLIMGSNIEQCVCKIRVLERTHEEFSLLPICYPNTRCVLTDAWLDNLPGFVDRELLLRPTDLRPGLFYLVGLLASVEILRAPISALADLARNHGVVIEVSADKLRHLKAMFPYVDIEGLARYVLDVVGDSERRKLLRSRHAVHARNLNDDMLFKLAGRVMYRIVKDPDAIDTGISWRQLIQYALEDNAMAGLTPNALSVIADRLIDDGMLVTHVCEVKSTTGDPYIIRTFAPDGEAVSARIRRQLMTRLPECLLMT